MCEGLDYTINYAGHTSYYDIMHLTDTTYDHMSQQLSQTC